MHTTRATPSPLALALGAALLLATGCAQHAGEPETAASQMTLAAAHEGGLVSIASSQIVVVRLRSKPSTGFIWDVAQMDASALSPLDEFHEFSGESSGEATHVHRFVPLRRGRTRLQLVYHRPWETDVAPAQTYSVDLDLQGAYAGAAPTPVDRAAQARQALAAAAATVAAADLPTRYSVCDGGCTPIKDQGQCGSCWAFATTGVVEQLILTKDQVTRDLSEQYLVSCNKQRWGCAAGGYVAFDLFIDAVPSGEPAAGAVYEADFPYRASDVACNPPHTHGEKLVSYTPLRSSAVADIKGAILAHGPLWTSVCADDSFARYRSGVFTGSGCSEPNHAVVLVGWDDNNGQGYWILRNSWGTGWGASGYMNVAWGANSIAAADNYYATYAGTGTCTPTTCAAQGKDCGTVSDGCGGTLSCGSCTAPQTCGGGGVANVCGGGGGQPDTYVLRGDESGRCIEIAGGSTADLAAAQLGDCTGAANQQLHVEGAGGAYFTLRVVASGKCLDVQGASTSAGASIVQNPCQSAVSQQWSVVDLGNGEFNIVNRSSGLVLDAYGAMTASGTPIIQWPSNGGANQRFRPFPIGG
jgi:C1A family cysteine protease